MAEVQYGGQAVIEGIMMRGSDKVAIAVRKSSEDIIVEELKLNSFSNRFLFLKWPFIRGIVALFSSLIIGIKALSFSASQVAEEEEEEISSLEMFFSIVISLGFAILLFIALPAFLISLVQPLITNNLLINLIEGLIKISTFIIYLIVISQMKDIKRVFMYHGAEHKVIHNYEAGLPLTVENAREFSRAHPRCGTNFIFIVLLLSVFFISFFGRPPLLQRILYHIMLLPVIAGTSYELLKLAGKDKVNMIVKILSYPGILSQKLTTREPDDSMLEVAISSLKAVLPD